MRNSIYKIRKDLKGLRIGKGGFERALKFLPAKTAKFVRAWAAVLSGAGHSELRPFYRTSAYHYGRELNQAMRSAKPFFPRIGLKPLALTVMFALVFSNTYAMDAFEAHVINITARISGGIPDIDPEGGRYCDKEGATVVLSSSTASATIIYTLNGSDPECGGNGNTYGAPFKLFQSAEVRARSCLAGKASPIASALFLVSSDYCGEFCGNGTLEEGEECDDGNNISGDGCSAQCTNECVASQEICDGLDNDCDGTADNNIFNDFTASSSPTNATLNNGYIVTRKVQLPDGLYATQSVSTTTYMYLDWNFASIPDDAVIGSSSLALMHRESEITIDVEYRSDSGWIAACDPAETDRFASSTCDLSGLIDSVAKARNVSLRLKLARLGSCHEDLDWAWLDIAYRVPGACAVCGNGKIETGENCDDGNMIPGDGCSAGCQAEDASSCMKINEVYYDPDICHGGQKHEWIELYNACEYEVNLKNWYLTDNGGYPAREKINSNYPIEAGGFVVLADNAQTWSFWPLIPQNAVKISLGGRELFDGLGDSKDRVMLFTATGTLADSVSWGDDKTAFDPAVPDVLKGHSISRKAKGVDTDTADDWMDTYWGSVPPGPNPGTNPHDAVEPVKAQQPSTDSAFTRQDTNAMPGGALFENFRKATAENIASSGPAESDTLPDGDGQQAGSAAGLDPQTDNSYAQSGQAPDQASQPAGSMLVQEVLHDRLSAADIPLAKDNIGTATGVQGRENDEPKQVIIEQEPAKETAIVQPDMPPPPSTSE